MINPQNINSRLKSGEIITQWPTIPEIFSSTVKTHPKRPCFTEFIPERKSWNYVESEQIILKIAGWLISKGIKKGDKIAVSGKNSPQWGFAFLATLYAGAIVVPIDCKLSFEETKRLIKHSESKFIFLDTEIFDKESLTDLKLDSIISLTADKDNYILDLSAKPLSSPIELDQDDLAAILYTSGTTGDAKGVMLCHKNIASDYYLSFTLLTVYPSDVFYALLPIHHSYTMVAVFVNSFGIGAECVFGKKIEIGTILNDLSKGKVTMFLGVPVLYNKIINGILKKVRAKGLLVYGFIRFMMLICGVLKKSFKINLGKYLFKGILKKASLDKVRVCVSGGGPLSTSTFKKYNQIGLNFVQGYGLTETSPVLCFNPIKAYKLTSVGKIIPQVDTKILNPDKDGCGEILVKGPVVMQGYYKSEQATQDSFTDDGYLLTGDVGYLDADNYLFLTGRTKSIIVTEGGKNVYPEEIESEFQLDEDIEQILVRSYIKDLRHKIHGIEAIIYPSENIISKIKNERTIRLHFHKRIEEVNNKIRAYKRIDKLTVVKEPMQMTSKRTIKRHMIQI